MTHAQYHSHAQRRRTWDLTQLSAKYPWLRVDSETLEEFRSPFQWVRDDDDEQQQDEEEERSSDNLPLVATKTETNGAPVGLPSSVYADFQALKADQRARQHQHQHKALKKQKPHNILSLSFPVLQTPTAARAATQNATSSLARQRAQLYTEELALHEQLRAQIEREKAKLPLTFLFERNLDKTYCKQQCVVTITSIFAKLQHRMLFYAFERWRSVRNAQRDQEKRDAAVKQAQTRALAFFERLASDAYVGTLARAFARWLQATKALTAAQHGAAATKIQGIFRKRRARALLKQLKQTSLDREYMRAMELRRLLAFESYGTAMKWRTLTHGFNLVLLALCARRITYFFRRIRTRKRIACRVQRKQAAITIQCRWRMTRAWGQRQKRTLAREIQRERERAATVHMQRRARGYLARQHAALRRAQRSNAHCSACSIQRAWRRHRDYHCLSRRFERRRQVLDELARIEAARRDAGRRHRVAVELQRVVRGFLGRREARRRRAARALEQAVRRVQQSWRKAKGRYALHVRFLAQRDRRTQRRTACALLLQCRFRVYTARRQREQLARARHHRRASAVAIQRIARGRHARQAYATKRRATVSIQRAWRGKRARDERTRRRQAQHFEQQQRAHATLTLQCLARGHQARRLARQRRHEQQQRDRLVQQSAVLIQKRARGMEARTVAALLRQAMQVVDTQQTRAYANSTQLAVTESALLAFVTQQSMVAAGKRAHHTPTDRDAICAYSREQLQLIQRQIDAATQHMACEDRAVVVLQRRYRGYATRVQCVVLQVQRQQRLALEAQATLVLQRVARGLLARRRVHKLRAKRRGDQLKEAYIRERQWQAQQRAFEDQYKHEQLALQLQRLQTMETAVRDAKREAEVAKWHAETAAARKQELQDQLAAARLARSLRGAGNSSREGEDEEGAEEATAMGAWAYVADAYGRWYYYNATTGASAWEKPADVEAPRPKNAKQAIRRTNAVKPTSATKAETTREPLDTAKGGTLGGAATTTPAPADVAVTRPEAPPEGFCCKCRAVEADKECLDCLLPDLTRDALYCNACFTMEHNVLAAAGKGRHDFKVLRALQTPSVCEHKPCLATSTTSGPGPARASYYCGACASGARFSCEACFPTAHETAQTSHHVPSALHFRAGALRCVECHSVLATRSCTQCDEAFCAHCFEALHSQSKSDHEVAPLEILKDDLAAETDAYCVDCEIRTCTKLCNLCGDGFCDACFQKAHSKGHKTQHTWISWPSFATHGDWLEILDDTTGKTIYFNIETKESTHAQPFVLQSGDERHRVLFQEREAAMKKKALELESEIVKLKEQLQTVAQDKDQEIDRLKRRKRGTDGDNEKDGEENASGIAKPKKKGLLGGLFGGRNKRPRKKQVVVEADKKLTPDEYKTLALQQSVAPEELARVTAHLTTRERAIKDEKARQTIGTKHFEQAMLHEFVQGS